MCQVYSTTFARGIMTMGAELPESVFVTLANRVAIISGRGSLRRYLIHRMRLCEIFVHGYLIEKRDNRSARDGNG